MKNLRFKTILILVVLSNILYAQEDKCIKLFNYNIDNIIIKYLEHKSINYNNDKHYFSFDMINFDTINCHISVNINIDSSKMNFVELIKQNKNLYIRNEKKYSMSYSDTVLHKLICPDRILTPSETDEFTQGLDNKIENNYILGGGTIEFYTDRILFIPHMGLIPTMIIFPIKKE